MRRIACREPGLVLAGVVGGVFLLCLLSVAVPGASAQEVPAGYLDAVTGEVTASHPRLGRRVLALEDNIYAQDVIATGPGAAARLVFRDKSVLEIKASSQVAVADFAFADRGEKAMSLKFAVGVFRMVTGEIVKANPDKFKVASPLSVIGIRGTDFASKVGGDSELHALFSAGTPITVTAGGRELRIDKPENGLDVTAAGPGAPRPLTEAEKKLFARLAFSRQMDMNRLQMLLRGDRAATFRPPTRIGHP